jgi:hypothetical protein
MKNIRVKRQKNLDGDFMLIIIFLANGEVWNEEHEVGVGATNSEKSRSGENDCLLRFLVVFKLCLLSCVCGQNRRDLFALRL